MHASAAEPPLSPSPGTRRATVVRILARLARRRRGHPRDEHGTVLVIVAGCMVLFLSAGAYTIDLGSGRQAETKAQSAADAAALAAADTLAACTGTTTTCDASATTAAVNLAQSNGMASNSSCTAGQVEICVTAPYNNSPYMAKVTEVTQSSPTFGGLFGRTSPMEGASSIANGTRTTSTTVTSTTQTVAGSTTSTTTGTTTNVTTSPAPVIFTGSTSCGGLALNNMNSGTFSLLETNGGVSEGGDNGGTVNSLTYNSACSAPSGTYPTIGSKSTDNGTLAYPIDPRQSQTIQCPNNNSTDYNGTFSSAPGTVTETDSGSSDNYSFSVSSITFAGGPNLSGVYCANSIDLSQSQNFTDSSGAPVTFIANSFSGINATLPSTLKSGALDGIVLWETGANQLSFQNGTFMATGATSNFVVFAPSAPCYVNNTNGWPSFNAGFSLECSTFSAAGFPNQTFSSPSGVGAVSTSTTTTTGTTTVPTTSTTVSSSTSTSTSNGTAAITG